MKIVGIDPGSIFCGYSVLEVRAQQLFINEIGVWELASVEEDPRKKVPLGQRLEKLHELSSDLFKKWNPQIIGLEYAVHHKNG